MRTVDTIVRASLRFCPLDIEIRYTDDFNQLRTYNTQLDLTVTAMEQFPTGQPMLDENGNPVLDEFGNPIMVDPSNPNGGEFPMPEPVQEKDFFAKIWDAIKSFFGFGSKSETPVDSFPMPEEEKPMPAPIPLPKGLIPGEKVTKG